MLTRLTNPLHNPSPSTTGVSRVARQGSSLVMLLLVAGQFSGCKGGEDQEKTPSPAPKQLEAAPEASASGVKEAKKPSVMKALGHRYAIGPELLVVPGRGVGAIRFGATFKTVERHMEAPCDLRTETRCLYVKQAIDFVMKDGVVVGMKAQMRDRLVEEGPPKGDKAYGSFRGAIPPNIMMGLHRHIVLEEFGEPERKEAVTKPPKLGLVDRHFYDGLILEYDKIQNGNIVLAGIEIVPSKTAPPAGPKNAKK